MSVHKLTISSELNIRMVTDRRKADLFPRNPLEVNRLSGVDVGTGVESDEGLNLAVGPTDHWFG